MIKPKRGYARTVHKAKRELPPTFCQNPGCGAKLSREQTREGYKYCDKICRSEHSEILKKERRPAQVLCSFCGKEIDTMRANPATWAKTEHHFCDGICVDGYRRQTGHYQDISKKGNEKAAEYRAKHDGKVINHKERSEAVSKNNRERPPKAKHFTREGRAWGYDVRFYPDENESGYRISVPELPELEVLYSKTVKEGLKLVRAKILELRAEEAKGE